LLIERSSSFRGYSVNKALLEFVEPDEHGQIVQLELQYEQAELEQMQQLITGIWRHIQGLDFPSPDAYAPTIVGIRQFERQLSAAAKSVGAKRP